MMNGWELPEQLVVGGRTYPINTDYRDVLDVIEHLQNPDDSEWERWYIAMALFYDGFKAMPQSDYQEAAQAMAEFIAAGTNGSGPGKPLLDWQQDAQLIAAGVSEVAGQDVRRLPYLHWWSFIGYFSSVGEGALQTVVGIRAKLQNHKPLEKWEREYYRDHRAQVDMRRKLSAEEQKAKDELEKLLAR